MVTCEIEGFAAMIMKNTLFWKVTPCCLIEVYRRFERNVVLLFSGSTSKPGNKPPSRRRAGLFDLEDGDSIFLRNVGELLSVSTSLQSRIMLFAVPAVTASKYNIL
jgi:hypothetical protein